MNNNIIRSRLKSRTECVLKNTHDAIHASERKDSQWRDSELLLVFEKYAITV